MEEQNMNEQFHNEEIKPEIQKIETTPQENTLSEKKSSGTCHKAFLILHIITLLAVAGLFYLYFAHHGKQETKATAANPTATKPAASQSGGITAAYINTDSLLHNYEYAKDLDKEMSAYKAQMEKSYQNQIMAFQNEVENYKKIGGTLTLTEQKKREAELGKKQQELSHLEGNMMEQIQKRQIEETTKLINAIYAFIDEYNKNNGKFTVIFKKSFADSPVLYMDTNVDLTKEIIKGLNAEYKEVKKDKEKK